MDFSPCADNSLKPVFAAIGVPEDRPFEPDPFQLESLDAIEQGDCLVTAPTGAGKTWIAEQAIAKVLAAGGRCWYASPLKALSNSKYLEFSRIFGADSVGILTGDRKESPEAPIIVGTTEILRNQLYDAMHRGEALKTDFVVLDEAHYLGDEERGVVWEEIMIYLPSRIPLLMLSATIGNADQIAHWLSSIRRRPCYIVQETQRPVPLFPLFLHPSGTLMPLISQTQKGKKQGLFKKVAGYVKNRSAFDETPSMGQILQVLKQYHLLPAIFFLKSRADCDRAIEACSENVIQSGSRKTALRKRIEELVSQSPYLSNHRQLSHLKNLAVGSHHSGQLPAWKLILEQLMTDGLLDAIFATSTVAAGVNFPARTVVFFNSDRFNGEEFLPLSPTEFHQMTGRAGRRGMDRIGFAIAVPGRFMDLPLIAKLIHAPPSGVFSQIRINFSMVLNLLLSHSPEQIQNLLEHSFANFLIRKYRHKKRRYSNHDEQFLWEDFLRHLDFLKITGYVTEDDTLTDDGKWASQLRVDQPLLIAECLKLGLLPESDPALLAAIITGFVNEQETNDRFPKELVPKKLIHAFLELKRGLRPFIQHLINEGFDTRQLFLRPTAAVFLWADGQNWERAVSVSEMEEGNFAMLILRTADNLRHIRGLHSVFPGIAAAAGKAVELLVKDPVALF